MNALSLILAFALLNCFRGRGWVRGDRILACAGMGLAAGLYAASVAAGLLVALGTYYWALESWGRGFVAITGESLRERLRAMWWMSLRGLHIGPLFISLAAFFAEPSAMLLGLIGLLQGPCYFVMRYTPNWQSWAVARAELLFGAVIGAALALCL